ncbi:MAG TPA: hypothetical protein VGQ46_15885 [Thermoanaerobaculia bacterium]|jgi:hypothetical protein|nr:hypothetical protein [Thermoanaerobaculia bacterium]
MGVVEEIDSIVVNLDAVLSKRRLKQSVRRDLEKMRSELMVVRLAARSQGHLRAVGWILQIVSLLARASEILNKHHH